MTREERNKLLDKLERMRFFNQRAGRELWADKPREIQDADIKNADEALYIAELALSKIKNFDGMTNGEVFQAIFPCDEVHINGLQDGYVHFSMKSNLDSMDCFSLEWWNAPYQKGSK